jgi:hypothetical protein
VEDGVSLSSERFERIIVVPTLGYIHTAVDSLKTLRGRCGPGERDQQREP